MLCGAVVVLGSTVVVNLLLRSPAAELAGVHNHVCELLLTPVAFARAMVCLQLILFMIKSRKGMYWFLSSEITKDNVLSSERLIWKWFECFACSTSAKSKDAKHWSWLGDDDDNNMIIVFADPRVPRALPRPPQLPPGACSRPNCCCCSSCPQCCSSIDS